jgi:flagellar L-ring protein precursor FlgH
MSNKFLATAILGLGAMQAICADPAPQAVGSTWGNSSGNATVLASGTTSLYGDPLAHGVGDLITIVVDLQNTITKGQNTTTAKTASVADAITQLVYPADATNKGFSWYGYHGQTPGMAWNANQAFNGGGTLANSETASTTIQARVIDIGANGVMRIQATRMSKAGEEDTSMILTGFVRPEDLSSSNSISSSRVAQLSILQKGKGAISEEQKKGWLTKLYEFLSPF